MCVGAEVLLGITYKLEVRMCVGAKVLSGIAYLGILPLLAASSARLVSKGSLKMESI